MTTFRYFLYGIEIESDIELPEVRAAGGSRAPDVRIRIVPGELAMPANMDQREYKVEGSRNRLWLHVPDVARFVVTDGAEIQVDPESGADASTIRLFLLGSALGGLLYQRGLLLLHGNAVRVDDACAICVGPTGVGKSSLAGAFFKRGFQLLSDDVVPIRTDGVVVPGFPRIKLWQDAADRLEIATDGLRRVRPDLDKYDIPIGDGFCTDPLPVRWIYALAKSSRPGIHIEPREGIKRIPPLISNTYRPQYMAVMELLEQNVKAVAELTTHVDRLAGVLRCEDGCGPDNVAAAILADVAAHSG